MNLLELDIFDRKDKGFIKQTYTQKTKNIPNTIGQWLDEKGFEFLGKGTYSMVWAHPSKPYVIKASIWNDEAAREYLEFAQANWKSNPLLPRVYQIWKGRGQFFTVMERLNHVSQAGVNERSIARLIDSTINAYLYKDMPNAKLPNYGKYEPWFKKNAK